MSRGRFVLGRNRAREAVRTRIDMYDERVRETVQKLRDTFPDECENEAFYRAVQPAYIGLLYEHKQPECAETFYNSVATRLLHRTYHQNDCIFSRPAISTEHIEGEEPTYHCYYPRSVELEGTLRKMLVDTGLGALGGRFEDLERDTGYLMRAFAEHFPRGWDSDKGFQLQVLRSLFFRGLSAYLVGRSILGGTVVPFVIPLRRGPLGDHYVDTILLDTKAVGRLFSLARDYFMVDMEVPSAYVAFLETVVPSRSRSELYTLIGLQKQGKTLHFRDLVWHLRHSTDKFEIAPGVRGMVMLVFSLPSFPYVFKVIRDWFEPPKDADRKLVEERYKLVKHHDRAGRMADSLEYVDVSFPKDRFREDLLDEMRRIAPQSVEIGEDRVLVRHLYVERKLVPLDMAVADADDTKLAQVLGEYGDCIKDLAAANIFPGRSHAEELRRDAVRAGALLRLRRDRLRHVVPLPVDAEAPRRRRRDARRALVQRGPGRRVPRAVSHVSLAPGQAPSVFCEKHPELATASYWLEMKSAIEAGRVEERSPYPDALRFAVRYGRGPR